MAFHASPSPFPGLSMSAEEPQIQTGPDLEEIQTEAIGFQAIAGEAKLRLLPSPWPVESLPPSTASLLSIASRKGLLAAAGPESVIVAGTDSVRQALSAPAESKIKSFTPQLTLPLGMRVSQVAFSADENYLVLSAENGGGLAVYEVQSLMQGNTQTFFGLGTNGTSLRALVPNPTSERAELFAAVSTNGELMIANLKTRQFITGAQGQVMKAGVSYVSWSNKGKQLVAGLGNGSLYPMTPEGEGKGDIPKPSGVDGDQFVSSISWLENDVFLVAHTPSSTSGDSMLPVTAYHVITRHPKQTPPSITYQKLPEPAPPFGLERVPSFQFMQRLRGFLPNLDDVIVVASTSSIDIGLITRSRVPLSDDAPAERISNVYTTTIIGEDSRRAQMPMSDGLSDTSPIGLGFDLSSKDVVQRPLPAEEYDASQGPLPALMALNNEGILSVWWFVYSESIRQGTTFPGLVVAEALQPQQQTQAERQVSPFANPVSQAPTSLTKNTFGNPSPSTFGSAATPAPAFRSPSTLGQPSVPFGGALVAAATGQRQGPTFGQSSFGASNSTPMGPTTQGTAFGMAGGMGARGSPWGTPSGGTGAATGAAFGRAGFNAPKASPFGAPTASGTSTTTSGAFTSFASESSPFMTATPNSGGESPFSKSNPAPSFGFGLGTDTNFGIGSKKDVETAKPSFASGAFTLGSTFKTDGSSASDMSKPATNAGQSMFGGGFGDALNAAQKDGANSQIKDADMDDEDHQENSTNTNALQAGPDDEASTTPAATPAPPKFNFSQVTAPPKEGGLFGTQARSKTTPAAVGSSKPTGFTIGTFSKSTPVTTTPEDTPRKAVQPRPSIETSPKIKEEPHSDDDGGPSPLNEEEAAPPLGFKSPETPPMSRTSEPPLPPESTSKASFAPGDSSNSSKSSDDAPMPPDFLPAKTKLKEVEAAPPEEAPLPSGDEDQESEGLTDHGSYDDAGTDEDNPNLDDEGSGVDVAQELSPTTDPIQSPKITPESSFGVPPEKSPPGGLFGRITAPPTELQKGKPPLFGEVGKTSVPYLPPPSKIQQSPRSPSPIRLNTLGDSLRPDNARSISAPGPFQALNNRKAALTKIAVPSKPQPTSEETRKRIQEQFVADQARRREEEEQDLSDREDERVREDLATEVEGTLQLDPFLAHQRYTKEIEKEGIPGQIEKVYRDINSMIDTLGINARSLKAFIKGHEESHKTDGRRTREDLEKNDWCLIEIADLPIIEDDLYERLETSSSRSVKEQVDECRRLSKDSVNLRARGADIVRAIDTHSDPNEIELARNAPLSLDQATQQHDLRRKMTKFQRLLSEAEEDITMLRAKLASCDTSNGKGPPMKKPTVEAVTNTIMKMTKIVQTKNSDIEVLENQLRNLRFSSVASQSSREGSPVNPASSKRKTASRLGTSVDGHHQTPNRASTLGRSMNGDESPRKRVPDLSQEEVETYREKVRRRREVNAIIKETFEKTGPRIRGLE